MNSRLVLFALLFVCFASLSAAAQCCCSGVQIKLVDGGGYSLNAADVKIKEVSTHSGRASIDSDKEAAIVNFRIGCGNGGEALLVEYGGSEMYLRFKFYGEFGRPSGELAFVPGSFVAEFAKDQENEVRSSISFRAATAEEAEELDLIKNANDRADQQSLTF